MSTGSIFRLSKANKIGLSNMLDGTMRNGSHDMKIFGTGTLRALATRNALLEFFQAHLFFYKTMEEELDKSTGRTAILWNKFSKDLRRASLLQDDVNELSNLVGSSTTSLTPATLSYVTRLREVGQIERETGTPLLLGHFYTRYLADLFGGSMIGYPTKLALSLESIPKFYTHSSTISMNRRDYVESIYENLNDAGKDLSSTQLEAIVKEAETAFKLNAEVYKEGVGGAGVGLFAAAGVGSFNVFLGFVKDKLNGGNKNILGR